jgi:hypothetical protein
MAILDTVTVLNMSKNGVDCSHYYKRLSEKQKKFVDEKCKELKIELKIEKFLKEKN